MEDAPAEEEEEIEEDDHEDDDGQEPERGVYQDDGEENE